jgi:hypothetical protein
MSTPDLKYPVEIDFKDYAPEIEQQGVNVIGQFACSFTLSPTPLPSRERGVFP